MVMALCGNVLLLGPIGRRVAASMSVFALLMSATEARSADYPRWNGKETIAQYAKRAGLPPTKTIDLGNGVSMEFVLIPAGEFTTGTPKPVLANEGPLALRCSLWYWAFWVTCIAFVGSLLGMFIRCRIRQRPTQFSLAFFIVFTVLFGGSILSWLQWSDAERALGALQEENRRAKDRYETRAPDGPPQDILFHQPFYLARYEVTQEQFERVMGRNPSKFRGPNFPVETVTWNDVTAFCVRFSEQAGRVVRPPTEMEWEYACRAGAERESNLDLMRVAWYFDNTDSTQPVGSKAPNAWGLYDMLGNVEEWCSSCRPVPKNELPAMRGGSWRWGVSDSWRPTPTLRHYWAPENSDDDLGFRVVLPPPERR